MKRITLEEKHLERYANANCKTCHGNGRAAYNQGYPVACKCVARNPAYKRLKWRAGGSIRARRAL